jgi:acetyltransferase
MLRVYDLDELFDAVETLAYARTVRGNRLAIITNGGGIGVLATDSLIDYGGRLAELAPATVDKLNAVLPRTWSGGNPVDIIGDAPGTRYAAALEAVAADPEVDGILALNCPTAISSGIDAAEAVIATGVHKRRMVMTSWVGHLEAEPVRRRFAEAGIPTFETPNQAVRAFMHMADYRRNQEALMEAPPSLPEHFTPDVAAARRAMDAALAEERAVLTEPEAKAVLAAYGIPVARTLTAATPEAAAEAARTIGGPIALKILSPDITHKSDVGGVILDLETPAAVAEEARAMAQRIGKAVPGARLAGFTVGEMVRRPGALELIVGLGEDPQFGPIVLFGQGGTAVEVIADRALTLPPLNLKLAHDVIHETRIFRQLKGYRDRPRAALDDIALTLVKVAQLAADIPEVAELDINPLLADDRGVIALDARVALRPRGAKAGDRFAIRPYPREIEEDVTVGDGIVMRLRPVRPEDGPAFQEMFTKLSPEAVRMRFFAPIKRLDSMMAGRLTQIDYDREMALVLARPGASGADEIHGVARLIADPDNEKAEYAVLVRSDWTGRGLGWLLMQRLIAYARKRGIGQLFGDVLAENTGMLRMCHELGFAVESLADGPSVMRVTLKL